MRVDGDLHHEEGEICTKTVEASLVNFGTEMKPIQIRI